MKGSARLSAVVFVCGVATAPAQEMLCFDCYRPAPPYAEDYAERQDYVAAVEAYYADTTFYLDCLNDSMQANLAERQDMMAEVRAFARAQGAQR